MQEKVLEIIIMILNEIRESKQLSEVDLEKLNSEGYTEAEINSAFAWIFSKIEDGEKVFNEPGYKSKSHRFLHEAEKNIITTEGQGFIIQMKELGVISDYEEELLLDKLIISGFHYAGVEELKVVLTGILFNSVLMDRTSSRMVFSNNETIH
ncbi:MAG: DUF494 family protein [Ignavibacteria bacterium]|jgi:uncharacterized protein Smg (DUF494 family)|nr:DUF494 family protein [Ignavibacteria bacterium]